MVEKVLVRVELVVMVIKRHSSFQRAPELESHHQIFNVISRKLLVGDFTPLQRSKISHKEFPRYDIKIKYADCIFAKMQSAYSIAPVN